MKLSPRYALIPVALSLCLVMLLTACSNKQLQYATVKQPNLPIPANLLIECQIPEIPTPFTYGDSVLLNFKLIDSLDDCNGKLRAIQQIEDSRSKS